MKKDARLEIRINSMLRNAVFQFCLDNGFKISDFVAIALIKVMRDKKFKLKADKRLKKLDLKDVIREKNADFYFIKNCYGRIMDISVSNYFSTGTVNIDMVREMLKDYNKLFNALDSKVKKIIKSDWKMLRMKLNNESFLNDQVENYLNYKAIQNKIKQIPKK